VKNGAHRSLKIEHASKYTAENREKSLLKYYTKRLGWKELQ
jgi:hypothetical protein